jgi:lipopolysaccharide export system permease protein
MENGKFSGVGRAFWPQVKIIDRYIMRKFLGTYLFAIALIIVVVVIFDAAEKIDDFTENKASLKDILFAYYLNFIPFFINQFSGLFTFIAVIFFTSKMAYNTEIVAILSSGTSFRRMMWPYFLSALLIAMLAASLNLYVIPRANEKRVDFELKYFTASKGILYERHIYRQIAPDVFAYIRDFSQAGNRASFLAIEKYSGRSIVSSVEASGVTYDPETERWSAPRYIERRYDGEVETMEKKERLDTLIGLSPTELGQVEKLVQTMNIGELDDFIEQQRSKGSDLINVFEVERHRRFAYPFSTFILTLIGVSLSSRKVRGGTGLHIGIGIGLCFSFILFSRFAEEFAKSGVIPAGISVWIPNMVYAVIAVYLYRKAPK